MSTIRALRILIKVRHRRAGALDEAVAAALRTHEQAQSAEQAAAEQVQSAMAAEQASRAKLASMMDVGQTFDANMMSARQHQIAVTAEIVFKAQGELERRASESALCWTEVRARRAEVVRNRQKIENLQGDIGRLMQAKQQAEDDQQDEEAEEAAISRLISAARKAQEAPAS